MDVALENKVIKDLQGKACGCQMALGGRLFGQCLVIDGK